MVQVASSKLGGSDLARPEETPKLGWFVYILCFAAVIGGFLFGYDTGIVSAAMLYAPESKSLRPMNSVWQEVIVAVTAGTAAIGSVFAGKGSDHFGRKKVILGASLTFTMMITIGMVVANVIGGLFSYVDPENVGWRLMFGFAAIPATIQFVIFIFLPESPRWLHEHGQTKEAKEVLNKIYSGNVTWIDYELSEIEFSYKEELASKRENGDNPIFLRVLRTPHVLKALLIGCALQMFQQLSGINTVMYYTANIIRSAAINFFGTFVPIFLIERLGRRILVLSSIVGVILSLSAMGVSFLLIHQDSAVSYNASLYTPATGFNDSYAHAVHCRSFTNCDTCVTDYACGFCEIKSARQGFCLPFSASDSADFSSTGLCSVVVNSTIEWENNYCHTKYTALPIIIMVIYLFCFSSGFAPVPWLLNAEFYPLWARSTCASISTSVNWIFNLIISLTFLSLTQALTKYGTFFLYAGCTVIAGVFIYFLVPETKGYSIDEIEMLFMTKKQRDQLKENVAREAARQRAESEQE